jgi:type II secretory pathway pseudopilin PulG
MNRWRLQLRNMVSKRIYRKMYGRPVVVIALLIILLFLAVPSFAQYIPDIISQVSQNQYQIYHTAIENAGLGLYDSSYNQGYRNRDGWLGGGSLGNQEASMYLANEFTNMGLDVSIQGDYRNVVAELKGTVTADKIYIVGGHYDTTGSGEHPGGDDNASGTAGVLEAARILSQYSFESSIRFIGFNAEEDWMLGSQDYVDNVITVNDENIAGMINLDMILRPAWDDDPTQPEDLDLGTQNTPLCLDWVNSFITAAHTYVPSLNIDSSTPFTQNWNAGDQGPFIEAGFAALMVIENTIGEIWSGSNAYYHSPEDASDGLANDPFSLSGVTYDYVFATDVIRATIATLAEEAVVIPEPSALLLLGIGALFLRRKI